MKKKSERAKKDEWKFHSDCDENKHIQMNLNCLVMD